MENKNQIKKKFTLKVNSKEYDYGIIIFSFVLVIALIFCFFILKKQISLYDHWNLINGICLISGLISFFGFIFSIYQIIKLLNIAKGTRIEIEKSLNKLSQAISVSDLATYIQIIQQCQEYVTNNNYDLALIRLQDIKRTLIKIKNISIVKDKDSDLDEMIGVVSEHITSISESRNNTKRTFNTKIINQNLEIIITLFSNIEDNIKYDNHE